MSSTEIIPAENLLESAPRASLIPDENVVSVLAQDDRIRELFGPPRRELRLPAEVFDPDFLEK